MAGNREIRKLFSTYSELLQLNEQDNELAKHLAGAAYRIGQMTDPVAEMDINELKKNFRPDIVDCIVELQETGSIENFEELIQLTPAGLFEMMQLKGLGGKKLAVLWKQNGIDSIDTLLDACTKGVIATLPGFGNKTQSNIIEAIEQYRSRESKFHYASVADEGSQLETFLRETFNALVSLCGPVRRKCNVVDEIELVATFTASQLKKHAGIKKHLIIHTSENQLTTGSTINEIPFRIHHVAGSSFYLSLFQLTGNDAHVEKVLKKTGKQVVFASEEDIYKNAKLPFIVPEMREDLAEWQFAEQEQDLLTAEDIKGVVHNHTTWSDGIDTLEDFANACREKKYDYAVISDHSKNAHYAGGLKEDQVTRQHKEIDLLNKKLHPFHLFKSIECDILISGALDYDDEVLKQFDLVIISIHQLLKMDEEKATARLIRAIENPYTTILGHMTGRQLLVRTGYPVNAKKVIDACAANGVVIEINANPYRLDIDWSHIPYALEKGVMISVNPDAHSIPEIDNIRWGVESARKGGLTAGETWNAMPLDRIKQWLSEKRKKAGI